MNAVALSAGCLPAFVTGASGGPGRAFADVRRAKGGRARRPFPVAFGTLAHCRQVRKKLFGL